MQYEWYRIIATLSISIFIVAGCDWTGGFGTGTAAPNSPKPSGNASPKTDAHYSSFGIRTDAKKFEVISFKDVGLGRDNPTPTDPLLEVIAQSVAYELNQRPELSVRPRVFRDASLSDPAKHTYCEDERVYIDVWRSESPGRWGYSLWSGCSAKQKFASNEVPIQVTRETADVEKAVEPLTEDIADSLADAVERECFRRTC